jgi:hypothetical protein
MIVKRIAHSGLAWLAGLLLANLAYVGWGWTLGSEDGVNRQHQSSRLPPLRPQSPSIGPSLRLLAELPAEERELLIEPPTELPLADVVRRVEMACQSWGPFESRGELEPLASDIAASGGKTHVTESVIPGRSEYLVHIGAPGKAENANRVLDELKSQNIDSALIARGRFYNTLSVGVFSRRDRAQRQLRRVSKLGYDAGIEEISHSQNVFHLEARVFADFESDLAPIGPCVEIAQAK